MSVGLPEKWPHMEDTKQGLAAKTVKHFPNIYAGHGRRYLKNLYEGAWVSSRSNQRNFVELAA
ncbi:MULTISPECIES: hypothetical protein [unclassified Bradyrhizobium]|uniref:hypothetical protein n=1 Tax=unclassified Bradyrhizobium TaxID=2631580 RepID=UPI003395ABF4